MAPQSRKRKSEAMDEPSRPMTPTGSPARKKLKITETQKQALIDNLQLEITERARKLRAHYALQCADLRSRVERRVNRIPMATRKMTMGELMAKHAAAAKPQPTQPTKTQARFGPIHDRPLPPLPQEHSSKPASPIHKQSPPKGKKRKSSQIHIARDNEDVYVMEPLPVAKKTRTNAAANAAPARATSRNGKQTNILSPRSHNSRTLPNSPVKQTSPMKSNFSRPMSPLKPASPLKTAASAASSAITASMHGMIESTKRGTAAAAGKLSRTTSREKTSPSKPTAASTANTRGKMLPPPRPAAPPSPQRSASQNSNTSDSSAVSSGTTVVKPKRGTRATAATKAPPVTKARATRAGAGTAATKPTASSVAKEKAAGAPSKGNTRTANKKVVVAEPASGRRVLRKRD
ncbi:uncharacterized protein HMPREF1541_08232 [Cyphellophora europaea CBS 101466]|uniref:Borealin N-terminal domain-containing protein n=1 Tax=Cyphellophora europaea (strain CBS 101466) TaxID=1220924 RepID=W2RL82_CYPE1|nr:uncharacterized protein HMPREF1541_08232 [Cyphellophora europaea CBS 101466]ETN37242.1 hypothetical protein HMPREF1541_08232 [Cyphellophora europaea CBS 101466]